MDNSDRERIRLIALQNKLFNCELDKLDFSKASLYSHARHYVERKNRVITECVRHIGKTIDPEVFAYRYNLLFHCVKDCADLEPLFPGFKESPSIELRRIIKMRPAETRRFIKRRWSHVLCSLDTMKSDKGKIERVKIFFKSLDMQFGKLDPATEALVVQLKREAADMLNCFEIFITIKCKD